MTSLGVATFLGFAFLSYYYRYRSCLDELGRCFGTDSGLVHLTQSGIIWLVLAVLALGYSVYLTWWRKQ